MWMKSQLCDSEIIEDTPNIVFSNAADVAYQGYEPRKMSTARWNLARSCRDPIDGENLMNTSQSSRANFLHWTPGSC
jgi:hypothetical protein